MIDVDGRSCYVFGVLSVILIVWLVCFHRLLKLSLRWHDFQWFLYVEIRYKAAPRHRVLPAQIDPRSWELAMSVRLSLGMAQKLLSFEALGWRVGLVFADQAASILENMITASLIELFLLLFLFFWRSGVIISDKLELTPILLKFYHFLTVLSTDSCQTMRFM